ncbi:MAG: hypothetical protein GY757_07730 [bacterium]|nr:hypothetical protein [bacterium]
MSQAVTYLILKGGTATPPNSEKCPQHKKNRDNHEAQTPYTKGAPPPTAKHAPAPETGAGTAGQNQRQLENLTPQYY